MKPSASCRPPLKRSTATSFSSWSAGTAGLLLTSTSRLASTQSQCLRTKVGVRGVAHYNEELQSRLITVRDLEAIETSALILVDYFCVFFDSLLAGLIGRQQEASRPAACRFPWRVTCSVARWNVGS